MKARLLAAASESPRAGLTGRLLVVERVRQWIFEGLLRDGDILSQEDLADVVGVSRIPVRDGLIALEGSGWVTIEPGIGAKALGLDAASIEDNFEIFNMIWALMIRRAVRNAGLAESLAAASDRVEAAYTPAEMVSATNHFVRVLAQAARAPRLEAAFRNAGRIVPGDIFFVVPGAIEVQRRYLPRIGRAVAAGDLEEALVLVASQQETHVKAVIGYLAARGVLGTSRSAGGSDPPASGTNGATSTGSAAIDWLTYRGWAAKQ